MSDSVVVNTKKNNNKTNVWERQTERKEKDCIYSLEVSITIDIINIKVVDGDLLNSALLI